MLKILLTDGESVATPLRMSATDGELDATPLRPKLHKSLWSRSQIRVSVKGA